EDARFLRLTYERLLQQDGAAHWLNDTHWVPHTDILRGRGAGDTGGHGDGVLGTQGDTGMGAGDSWGHGDRAWALGTAGDTGTGDGDDPLGLVGASAGRAGFSPPLSWRALVSSFLCPCPGVIFRKKRLRFGRSRIHEWGLFAMEPIAADEMVIEYVGQNIRQV
ncbi:SE1BA methyltransferase, partial [Quiscalus mexicanus]|nr:SE1BA methyltransferase [Quiscalus mexicanus]